jgi:protein involved in polysaccharide export with SLBB domain
MSRLFKTSTTAKQYRCRGTRGLPDRAGRSSGLGRLYRFNESGVNMPVLLRGHLCGVMSFLVLFALRISPVLGQSPPVGAGDPTRESNLRPGDMISLKIWREPDLSDTLRVDADGIAVFPKLGPMLVTDVLPDSLQRFLVASYSRYLQNPSIEVTFSRRITIWGAVNRPGPYPVDRTMTITDALSLAGGATQEGKANRVELRRGDERTVIDLSGDPRVWETPLRSGDQLFVPQRSWFSRNTGLVLGAVGTLTSLVYLVTR